MTLGPQAILNTISVFVLAANEANIGSQSKHSTKQALSNSSFRPKTQDTGPFRLEVVNPYIRFGASPPYRVLHCLAMHDMAQAALHYKAVTSLSGKF